jgi:hypothetical protein
MDGAGARYRETGRRPLHGKAFDLAGVLGGECGCTGIIALLGRGIAGAISQLWHQFMEGTEPPESQLCGTPCPSRMQANGSSLQLDE